jgi:hypothetical protein
VYLKLLVDDLLLLWKEEGVRVWDVHAEEHFNLRALLFITINDWPALSNMSGHSNKGYSACTHCLHETDSMYLNHCRKIVYMGHRRFVPVKHPLRKKHAHYGKKADRHTKPMHVCGKMVFEMVKDIKVVFGKGAGSRSVCSEGGRAPMWKKKSIFWELPYWEVLEVHNTIDVMHLTKNLCANLLGFLGVYGKPKDALEARQALHPEKRNKGNHYLCPAYYTLSKEEKKSIFACLNNIKIPSGYS